MNKAQIIGIWVYSIICVVLILIYRYYTEIFEPKILGYNLALWSALIANIVLLVSSTLLLREFRLLLILGIVLSPVSVYLFYTSWTNMNYEYLAGFITIPIILLLISTLRKLPQKPTRETLSSERLTESAPIVE